MFTYNQENNIVSCFKIFIFKKYVILRMIMCIMEHDVNIVVFSWEHLYEHEKI